VVATDGVRQVVGVAIYVGCLIGLFGVSALYHRGTWGPVASRNLQRADHVMIFLLVAGTATPMFLLAVPGTYGLACLIVLWSLSAVAIGTQQLTDTERTLAGMPGADRYSGTYRHPAG
jgi:hemolysin III